jgi:hypothetical protein
MYWKPHLTANARIARARNMWTIWTTPKISETIASTERKLWSITAAILIRSHDRV